MNDYLQKSHDIREYLKADVVVDYGDKSVSRLADTLYERSKDSLDYIRNVYDMSETGYRILLI